MRSAVRVALAFLVVSAAASCAGGSTKTQDRPAEELGLELFNDHTLSPAANNRFSCATCHATNPADEAGVIFAGYDLRDAAVRPGWFNGYSTQFLDAVNFCLVYFMRGDALTPADPDGDALYAYLASISPDSTSPPVTYTLVRNLTALTPGDAVHGKTIYDEACILCHGDKDTGAGRISTKTTILNAQLSANYDTLFPGTDHNLVVTEKVRHGRFYGVAGNMPFFTEEKLSDADLADLEAYLHL